MFFESFQLISPCKSCWCAGFTSLLHYSWINSYLLFPHLSVFICHFPTAENMNLKRESTFSIARHYTSSTEQMIHLSCLTRVSEVGNSSTWPLFLFCVASFWRLHQLFCSLFQSGSTENYSGGKKISIPPAWKAEQAQRGITRSWSLEKGKSNSVC